MAYVEPLGPSALRACVESLRTATEQLEQLSPASLAALARAAARFVRGAKQLRRQRARGGARAAAPARTRAERTIAPAANGPSVAAAEAPPRGRPRRVAVGDRRCYACRMRFSARHFFYDSLCPGCAEHNFAKRTQTADLSGRLALVTGARVTSGYATALKLLRAGAVVLGTSRFPRDAAARFAAEPDFRRWSERLHLYGLDLRSAVWVEAFAAHVASTWARLDVLVNNAAQTVRRPVPFYSELARGECAPGADVAAPLRRVLEVGRGFARDFAAERGALRTGVEPGALAALMSQVPVLPEDAAALGSADGLVRDARASNTWMLRLGEISTPECLEVLLVNAAAPLVLAGRLRSLMARDVTVDKWIVNVAAVEGQFSRRHKDERHPHLNMAKAALNMLTRSAAADYARDRIYMNSVDVGWFSHGEPAAVAAAMRARGFTLPLDETDAAARICDPIFSGVRTGANQHGRLLKDYCPVAW